MGSKQARRLREIARDRRADEDLALLGQVRQAFRADGCGCAECLSAEKFLRATLGPEAPAAHVARYWRGDE